MPTQRRRCATSARLLRARREIAYTVVMTVLHRLARKGLIDQIRDDRAFRHSPAHGGDELLARLTVDALDQVADPHGRHAALLHFVEQVGFDETEALHLALAELDGRRRGHGDQSHLDRSLLFSSPAAAGSLECSRRRQGDL